MEEKNTEKGRKFRVRIINKSKDGVIIDFKGEIGLKKTTWEEFNKIYQICADNPMFAEPTDEHQKLLDEINEHINTAVVHFIMSGGYAKMQGNEASVKSDESLLHLVGLGDELEKIQELTGMNVVQVSILVRQRVNAFHFQMEMDALKEQHQLRAQHRRDWEKERHTQNVVVTSTNSLGDNPLLKQLKEQMDKENHKNTEK